REKIPMLVGESDEQRLAGQDAGVMIVLFREIRFLGHEGRVVDAAYADHMPDLLAEGGEAFAMTKRGQRASGSSGRIRRKLPFVVRDDFHKVDRHAVDRIPAPPEVVHLHETTPPAPSPPRARRARGARARRRPPAGGSTWRRRARPGARGSHACRA